MKILIHEHEVVLPTMRMDAKTERMTKEMVNDFLTMKLKLLELELPFKDTSTDTVYKINELQNSKSLLSIFNIPVA